jgi:hypothetical protein
LNENEGRKEWIVVKRVWAKKRAISKRRGLNKPQRVTIEEELGASRKKLFYMGGSKIHIDQVWIG